MPSSSKTIVAEKTAISLAGGVHLNENTLAATFVDPDYTEERIGRALIRKPEKIARKEGYNSSLFLRY
ncbi:GNAT family N-acetyltransferase [Halobellus captivus]|uniref:GNAT family N-acetyltransferase n=1 Tax=Halobellus captivus TaxID=2592614 RepID=UPI0031F2E663